MVPAQTVGISSPNEEHFGYYEPHNFKMFRQAQDDLRQYIETDGPFDGVMAFSQGCSVAAAFILELQRAKSKIGDSVSGAQAFKCAVFLAGRPPYIDADLKNTYSGPRGEDMGLNEQISIPTVHIWGRNDRIEPGNALALHNICSREDKRAVVHNGGHEVPGARDKDAVIDSAHVVKRMIASISR
ncbi:MAG: hypothetical protein M1820_000746 [Bogoriella megaspora]|nr:MAG: hypothetical protein M1820_000746 [Bogoriella megaspora]